MALLPMLPFTNLRLPFPNSEDSAAVCQTAWPSHTAVSSSLVLRTAAESTVTLHFQALEYLARLASIMEEAIYITWHEHRQTPKEKKRLGSSLTKWFKGLPPALGLHVQAMEQVVLLPEVAHLHLTYNTLVIFVRAEMNYFQPPPMTDILLSKRVRQAATENALIVNNLASRIGYRLSARGISYAVALSLMVIDGMMILGDIPKDFTQADDLISSLMFAITDQLETSTRNAVLFSIFDLSSDVADHWERTERYADDSPMVNGEPFACWWDKSLPDDRALADPLRRLIAFIRAHLHKRDSTTDDISTEGTVGNKRKLDVGLHSAEAVEGNRPAQKPRIGAANGGKETAGMGEYVQSKVATEVSAWSTGAQTKAGGDESGEGKEKSDVSREDSVRGSVMAEEADV